MTIVIIGEGRAAAIAYAAVCLGVPTSTIVDAQEVLDTAFTSMPDIAQHYDLEDPGEPLPGRRCPPQPQHTKDACRCPARPYSPQPRRTRPRENRT